VIIDDGPGPLLAEGSPFAVAYFCFRYTAAPRPQAVMAQSRANRSFEPESGHCVFEYVFQVDDTAYGHSRTVPVL